MGTHEEAKLVEANDEMKWMMRIVAQVCITIVVIFALFAHCEMHRIDANKELGIKSQPAGSGLPEEKVGIILERNKP